MVADLEPLDAGTERFHDTGALVTENDRHRIGQRAFDHLEVGVTEARRHDAHQHVARLEAVDPRAGHLEGLAHLVQDRGVELDHGGPRSLP